MKRSFKRLTRLAVACLLILTLLAMAGVAAASPKEGRGPQGEHGDGQFEDADEAPWAAMYMEKMNLEGVVKGMPDGTFRPNQPVTHEQAVAMVLRVMGLEDQVQARVQTETQTELQAQLQARFGDAAKISSWAQAYVAEALDKGILSWGDDGRFKPNEPTTRLEVAVMLIKALGLADQAAQQTGKPAFTDSATIPPDKVGYILVAVDKGLVTGAPNPNGKGYVFQANKPVTRAEMTAFMDREDEAIDRPDEHEVKGTVAGVGAASITITKKDGTQATYDVAADARIFVEKKPGQLADIKAGDQANIHLDQNGVAFFLDIRYVTHVGGTVKAIDGASLTIIAKNGQELTYPIDPNCKVVIEAEENENEGEGDQGATGPAPAGNATGTAAPAAPSLADVKVGDPVGLELTRGVVTKIEVKELDEVEGTVTAVTAASGTTPGSITVKTKEGATLTYGVASEVQVRFEHDEQAANFSDIVVGDKVQLKFRDRLVAEIKVEEREGTEQPTQPTQQAQTQTLNGTVKSLDAAAKTFVVTVQAGQGGAATDYAVTTSDSTTYLKNGQPATFADLAVGQTVAVTGQAGASGQFAAEKVEIK